MVHGVETTVVVFQRSQGNGRNVHIVPVQYDWGGGGFAFASVSRSGVIMTLLSPLTYAVKSTR